ncbi:hypothetical protein BB561_004482 [Smittium simulii]|uniref:L domain-like protein n=1 Tax=Smittium simulii TaxID=133385 RepID=A0A2T9YG42_9FUNG|nr:hypothetical protein BB561_004482 [Smittium simulii]
MLVLWGNSAPKTHTKLLSPNNQFCFNSPLARIEYNALSNKCHAFELSFYQKLDETRPDSPILGSNSKYSAQTEKKFVIQALVLDFSFMKIDSFNVIGTKFNFTHIRILKLNNNNLSSIPPSIVSLVNLTVLNLSGNKISSEPKPLKIELFSKLLFLKELILSQNSLTVISRDFGNPHFFPALQLLDLSCNNITRVPVDLFAIKKVKLDQNPFSKFNKLFSCSTGDLSSKYFKLSNYQFSHSFDLAKNSESKNVNKNGGSRSTFALNSEDYNEFAGDISWSLNFNIGSITDFYFKHQKVQSLFEIASNSILNSIHFAKTQHLNLCFNNSHQCNCSPESNLFLELSNKLTQNNLLKSKSLVNLHSCKNTRKKKAFKLYKSKTQLNSDNQSLGKRVCEIPQKKVTIDPICKHMGTLFNFLLENTCNITSFDYPRLVHFPEKDINSNTLSDKDYTVLYSNKYKILVTAGKLYRIYSRFDNINDKCTKFKTGLMQPLANYWPQKFFRMLQDLNSHHKCTLCNYFYTQDYYDFVFSTGDCTFDVHCCSQTCQTSILKLLS